MTHAAHADAAAMAAFLRALHPTGGDEADILQLDGHSAEPSAGRQAAIVQFAPTAAQCAQPARLESALMKAVASMSEGAILYVIAPARWRRSIARSLRRRGLKTGTPVVHLAVGEARYCVPLSATCLQFALRTWPQSRRWLLLAWLLRALPSTQAAIAAALPTVGFAAYRPGARPCDWLLGRLGDARQREAIVATSWRGPAGATLVFAMSGGRTEPTLVAKLIPRTLIASARQEAEMLQDLAPTAESAGARVPSLVTYSETDGAARLIQSAVAGRPASIRLSKRTDQLGTIVGALAAWLAQWHSRTCQRRRLDEEDCERLLLGPARSLGAQLERGDEYLARLSQACSSLMGTAVPFVSAHNDLTMSNVLVGAEGRLGIVDWETASAEGLPLTDFWYAACDAVAACNSEARPQAFDRCFLGDGAVRALVLDHQRRLQAAVQPPANWLELCFHACWLHHAVNEQVRDSPANGRPFMAIVRRLPDRALGHTQLGL